MKPDKYNEKLKEYYAASKRINELYRSIWDLPRVDVSKDRIFAGDWRFFVVRKDILRSSIGENIQAVVDVTQSARLGRRDNPKSYLQYNYLTRRYEDSQELNPLSDKTYTNYNFPAKVAKYFKKYTEIRSIGSKNIEIYSWHPVIPKWMLEYDYKRAYLLETRDAGYELQSELDKLQAFMRRENGYEKLCQSNYDWEYHFEGKFLMEKVAKRDMREEVNLALYENQLK